MYPIFYLIAIRDLIVYKQNRVPVLCSYLLYYVPTFIVIEFIPSRILEKGDRGDPEDGLCNVEINKSSASTTCLHTLQMKTQEAAFRQGWDTEVTYIYVAGMSSKVL